MYGHAYVWEGAGVRVRARWEAAGVVMQKWSGGWVVGIVGKLMRWSGE